MASLVETEYGIQKIFHDAEDFLPLLGTDFVEFYVGDAKQTAHYYKTAFGFQSYAYAGIETGQKDTTSYVVTQDKIKLIFLSNNMTIFLQKVPKNHENIGETLFRFKLHSAKLLSF